MSRCNGVAIVSQPSNSNCISAAGRHVISRQIASVGARPVVRRTRPSGENRVTVASTNAASRSMTARRGSSSSSASIRWSWSEDSRCIARTSVLSSEALTALTTSRKGVRSGIANTGTPRLRASSSSAGGTRLNATSTPKPSAAAPISFELRDELPLRAGAVAQAHPGRQHDPVAPEPVRWVVDLDAVRASDPTVARVLAAGNELEPQVAVEELAQRQSGKLVQRHGIATYLRAQWSPSAGRVEWRFTVAGYHPPEKRRLNVMVARRLGDAGRPAAAP